MKHLTFVLALFVLLLSACATPATATVLLPTETATAAPTMTETPAATATTLPTATATKVPATPTVDLASLPTLTPQAPAACPQVDAKAKFSVAGLFKNKKLAYYDVREATLEFLNRGGDPQIVIQKLGENGVAVTSMDITNDGLKELLVPSGYLSIFGCQGGQYKTLLDIAPIESYPGPWAAVPLVIQDLNKNGIPEIIIAQPTKGWGFEGFMQFADYSILEWDGKELAKIISGNYTSRNNSIEIKDGALQTAGHSRASNSSINGNWKIEDTDNNGLKDVTILAGINDAGDASQLEEKVTLKWDGKNYKVSSTAIESTATPTPTWTPQPFSATCAYSAPNLRYNQPKDAPDATISRSIMQFLNAGGNPEQLKAYYGLTIRDLNNDKLPEILIINNNYVDARMHFFSCENGKYKDLLYLEDMGSSFYIEIMTIRDINLNGLPEVVIDISGCPNMPCGAVYIVEWNAGKFTSLVKDNPWNNTFISYAAMDHTTNVYLKDLNNDKIPELIWEGGIPGINMSEWFSDGPWRLETHTYQWDGKNYVALPIKYATPIYRFQAIQDGDRAARRGDYVDALSLYQKAIFSDGLDWWSPDKSTYMQDKLLNEAAKTGKTLPTPIPYANERPQISAYAYFREMLVYLLTGKPEEAQKNYDTLLRNYVGENPGAPYTEMATAFWIEYQKAQNMGNACKAAVAYATQHPDLLKPLGSDYHGMQSLIYKAADVCPFR